MLVLTRRCNESLLIGDEGEISIRVLEVKGRQVRIGIEAPKSVAINREEIFELNKLKQEEQEDVAVA